MKECQQCGEQFEVKQVENVYCSLDCLKEGEGKKYYKKRVTDKDIFISLEKLEYQRLKSLDRYHSKKDDPLFREEFRHYLNKYYVENREKHLERTKRYYRKKNLDPVNLEKQRSYERAYQKKHAQKYREYAAKYYRNKKDDPAFKEKLRLYYQQNKERIAASARQRYAKKKLEKEKANENHM